MCFNISWRTLPIHILKQFNLASNRYATRLIFVWSTLRYFFRRKKSHIVFPKTGDAPFKPCYILCVLLTYFNGAYGDNINILITFTLYNARCGFNTMSAQCSVVLFIHSLFWLLKRPVLCTKLNSFEYLGQRDRDLRCQLFT